MMVVFKRQNNFMIKARALKIYVDDVFVDYINPEELIKKINISDNSSNVYIKLDWCFSNKHRLNLNGNEDLNSFTITSQIQNSFFLFIYSCFFLGWILRIFNVINIYTAMALVSTISIIVFWQTFGRNNYLRLSRNFKDNL
jgi:hypothetical protein